MKSIDVMILGAGAAGLMCAIEAGKRNQSVLVLEKSNKPGKKILMSGGGRCNFTNLLINPQAYLSHNSHFCKSALSQYTAKDFIEKVEQHGIDYVEKKLGQLFCTHKAKDILNMLLLECDQQGVTLALNTHIKALTKHPAKGYQIQTSVGNFHCQSLVVATGGLSIPTLGSSPMGYQIAQQFKIRVWPTRAGLVPFTLHDKDKQITQELSGISFHSQVSNEIISFKEDSLCTHRGLSGPAMLQLSSYWKPGEPIVIDLLPDHNIHNLMEKTKRSKSKKQLKSILGLTIAKRLLEKRLTPELLNKNCFQLSPQEIQKIEQLIHHWTLQPNGTEGYRTAEVTLGGVDCDALSSKTMESKQHQGLYFIGEVVDVTGWLGGYNFQWAWSSGYAAGQHV